MKILHLDLKRVTGDNVELRYFQDNQNQYEPRSLRLKEIDELIEIAERDYYVNSWEAVDYVKTGQQLYGWLDGSDCFLQNLLHEYPSNYGVVLAIAVAEKLAHLPWEVLHDGEKFLVERAIVPVRWVSSDKVKKLSIKPKKTNRALQVLFMASSPIDVEPVLDYETEEARILEATKVRSPEKSLALIVEESGSLEGLKEVINPNGEGTFDILHLTGHATKGGSKDGKPSFITETVTGEAYHASARDIVDAIPYRLPELVFLSGCHTGRASRLGAVSSLAQELLESRVQAVLGWGNSVSDKDATLAAKVLYQQLSQGMQVAQAVAQTYKELIRNNARDWHLLRLYTKETLPGELVTPWNTPRRKPAPRPSVAPRLFEQDGNRKVATRESFVGRRRQIQNCLRELIEKTGVLIHGMGGLGKASLAARLCDRLSNYEQVVWVEKVDEQSLVSKLAQKLNKELREKLEDSGDELKYRLRDVFELLHKNGEKHFLLVLVDFEENLELRNDKYMLTTEAVTVLNAIVWAIEQIYSSNRIIITCRYDFDFTKLQNFYKQPLDAMRGADLQKKWKHLFPPSNKSQEDEKWQSQMKKLADGNLRLLEFLYEKLQKSSNKIETLKGLEDNPVELQKQVLTKKQKEDLKKQIDIDPPMREMLQRGLVYELPVPRKALEEICQTISNLNLEQHIKKAIALGLLEVSYDKELLRVPRILHVVNWIEKLDETSSHDLYRQATNVLCDLWFKPEEKTLEERLLEIHRLAKLGNVIEVEVEMTEILARRWNSRRSRLREVVELCTSTLDDLKKVYSDDVPKNLVMEICSVLAASHLLQGNYGKAIFNYSTAQKQLSEEEDLDKAKILDGLGYSYSWIGEYKKAKPMLEEALKIRKEKLKLKEHPDIAQSYSHLAYWHREQCHWEQAEFYYDKALTMYQQLSNEDDLVIAESYHNLGTVYFEQALHYQEQKLYEDEQKFYKKAESLYQQALYQSQYLQGQEPLSVATFLSSLAKVWYQQESYSSAQNFFLQALEIRRRVLGDHFKIVQDKKNLGFTNYTLEQYPDAERYFCQALNTINQLIKNKNSSLDENQNKLVRDVKEILGGFESIYKKQSNSEKAINIGYQKQEIADDENHTISLLSISKIIQAVLELLGYDNKI
ncbi:tetratricopeptide repeat protein [Brasilonema sp. UFV-L1]|uniref:tetratricopeptide repeat protein n=1 Tax=Brasilonema sp. UFV-L1 TaxID=2234130 RepID=UPI00145ED95C|nr:tetratricopeptide repeat protein [Brasilonema sp. UFV-L1]NMG06406.1 NB-ARC domain-containing protein [Brasilonema sp. UFV-L1]